MSNIDEIKKLKKLLDDGIITEADFNNQKKRILGLNSKENDVNIENGFEKEESTLKNTLDNYKATLINELAEENDSLEKVSENEINDVEEERKKQLKKQKKKQD